MKKTLAEQHGLKVGDRVIVVTHDRWGKITRKLFLYDTAASWFCDALDRDVVGYTRTVEPWDGVEWVDFDNGD